MNNNILLVANWDSNVGYAWWLMENFWSEIAKEFYNKGHSCILIYPSISIVPSLIKESPIQIIEHDFDDRSLIGLCNLISIIRKHHIAYIYLSDKQETSFRYVLLKLSGVKIIFVHDHTPGERQKLTGYKKALKKIYKKIPFINADVFIAVTDYIKQRMLESSGLPAGKCFVAKNGINPIGRNPKYRYYAHNAFNLPHDSIIIISTGRANYYKQIDLLIQSFAQLLPTVKMTNLFFIFCGEGPHLQDFKDFAVKLEVDKNFIFAGKRDDIILLLQSCDIGVQASKGEVGYSLSILEYMSAGLATLVPNNPSVCQSIKDGRDGLYFECNNPASLCDKLLRVIEDKDLRYQLGTTASQTVENNFSLQNTNRELLAIMHNYIHTSR